MTGLWYVAYGSNLCLERFLCYIKGGRPDGAARTYPGCVDTSAPRTDRAVRIPGQVYFAGESSVWGGGMAFLDGDVVTDSPARAYLLGAGQAADVVAQENRGIPDGEPLGDLPGPQSSSLRGLGQYGRLVRLADIDGTAAVTVTTPNPRPAARPAARYLGLMATGLGQVHGMSRAQAAEHLCRLPGADGAWSVPALLAAWADL